MLNQIDQLFNMAATIKYLMVIVGMSHNTSFQLKTKEYHMHMHTVHMELKKTKHILCINPKM